MPPYLYTKSRLQKGMIPFVYNREITKDERYYKMLGNRFCSPAKIIKRYLKRIFECIYGELEKKRFKFLNDLRDIDIFFDTNDYNCIFNPLVYSEVLDLYLVYLTLYKKYGFTKDYLDRVILKDTNLKTNSKPKFNYFDTSGDKWKKRIRLPLSDQNIILLREIPFFIEDFFRVRYKKIVSQEVVYMFSLFYLYFVVDYEFLLSNNETIFGQEILFKENLLFQYFFDYILEKNHKDYLKKYTVNEEIMCILKKVGKPFLGIGNVSDYVDYNMVKEVFEKNNIKNFDYKKMVKNNLLLFIDDCLKENFENPKNEICTKIYEDFVDIIEEEKIFCLINDLIRQLDFFGLTPRYKFGGLGYYRFSRLRDRDNKLKKRRFQDIKISRLYLTFCGEENMKKIEI